MKSKSDNKKVMSCLLVMLATVLFVSRVLAHGTMETPVSRVYNCYLEGPERPQSSACQAAVRFGGTQAFYDWNGVNQGNANDRHREIIPDGRLCSAGKELFKGLDLARNDWPSTTIMPRQDGTLEFVFRATAPHATRYFRFYVTRDGYDPTQALKWSDLEDSPFCTISNVTLQNGRYKMNCTLPQDKTGQHIIYSIWQRSDSAEAFYTCMDVDFSGTAPTGWTLLGQLRSQQDLPVGSKITFRLFDAALRDAETHIVELEPGMAGVDVWPYHLAQTVNAESALVNIGVLNPDSSITPIQSRNGNSVYVRSEAEYSFQVDIELPDPDPGNPPPGGGECNTTDPDAVNHPAWDSTRVYTAPATVSFEQLVWEAKWWNQGNVPTTADGPWKLISDVDLPWDASTIYTGGKEVNHNANRYRAKWWTRGAEPGVASVWELIGGAICN